MTERENMKSCPMTRYTYMLVSDLLVFGESGSAGRSDYREYVLTRRDITRAKSRDPLDYAALPIPLLASSGMILNQKIRNSSEHSNSSIMYTLSPQTR